MKSTKDEINDVDFVYHSIRNRVNNLIINYLPEAWKKFTSINSLLQSDNIETRSNAVNSCRRILKNLADLVFSPTEEEQIVFGKKTSVAKKKYKNRLMAFLDSTSSSKSFKRIVGDNLNLYWRHLDGIHKAGNKGAHQNILTKEEAETYIINTYLLVGDILTLWYLNRKPEDLIRGLGNSIFYLTDNKKTVLNLNYPTKLSPYKLVVSRNTQLGTRLRIYVKEDNTSLYDYDIQDLLPEDIKGFRGGELSKDCYLQIGTYQFSKDSFPMLLVAIGGGCSITFVILQYQSKDAKEQYFGLENWKIVGRFQGQSVAILRDNQIYMPFGSVGFARLIKFAEGIFTEEEGDILLKKELIFGEHPDM